MLMKWCEDPLEFAIDMEKVDLQNNEAKEVNKLTK